MGEDGDLLVDNGEGGLSERQGDGGIGAMAARSGTVCDREQEPADASNSIAVCCSVLSLSSEEATLERIEFWQKGQFL